MTPQLIQKKNLSLARHHCLRLLMHLCSKQFLGSHFLGLVLWGLTYWGLAVAHSGSLLCSRLPALRRLALLR